MLAEDRAGDMVALFMTEAAAIPAPFVDQMRQAPFWGAQEAFAHTLVNDAAMIGDFSVPAVAAALPDAGRRKLAGQQHNVDPTAIAPVLADHFDA